MRAGNRTNMTIRQVKQNMTNKELQGIADNVKFLMTELTLDVKYPHHATIITEIISGLIKEATSKPAVDGLVTIATKLIKTVKTNDGDAKPTTTTGGKKNA